MYFKNYNLLKFLLFSSSLYSVNAKLASIYNKCNKPGVVALTIDDGPHGKLTPKVLDLLKENNIKATFFINGNNFGSDIENSEETKSIIKRQIKEGHDIGSHTYFHKDCFPAYDDGTLKENIERLQNGIEKVIGRIPRFFRPPEGQGGFSEEYCKALGIPYDPKTEVIRSILGGDGQKYGSDFGNYDYDIILWNADSEDWKCDGSSLTYKDAIDKLNYSMGPDKANKSKDSFIILVHDVHEYSVNTVIPEIIKYVRSLGYKFVPLSECIGRSPYRSSNSNASKTTQKTSSTSSTSTSSTHSPIKETSSSSSLSNASSSSPVESNNNIDTNNNSNTNPNTDINTNPNTDINTNPNTDINTNPNVDANNNMDTSNINTDINSNANTNSDNNDNVISVTDVSLDPTEGNTGFGNNIEDSGTNKLSIITLSSIMVYIFMIFFGQF